MSYIFIYRLMLGLMLPTWFLSMWISNTAATSMMIPIIQAVMTQIREAELGPSDSSDGIYQVLYGNNALHKSLYRNNDN